MKPTSTKIINFTLFLTILAIFAFYGSMNHSYGKNASHKYHYNIVIKIADLYTPYIRYSVEKTLSDEKLIKNFEIKIKSLKIRAKSVETKLTKSELEEEILNLLKDKLIPVSQVKARKIR